MSHPSDASPVAHEPIRHGISRPFIGLVVALFFGALTQAAETNGPRVTIAQGTLEGVQDGSIRMFLGVPFAAPPVGALRWAPPQPATAWTGLRPAKTFGARCMQGPIYPDMIFRDPGTSEDCLTLNIWTPARKSGARLPVMVWIFGGGFQAGGTSEPRQDGAHLAKNGVVVVSLNYRLGIFGFLAHPALTAASATQTSGNYGLLDQTAALRWVQQNIAAFGGDPHNVTLFGESAGSYSVNLQMASPLAKGLFQRAIGESGGGALFATAAEAAGRDAKFLEQKLSVTTLEQLRALPADRLLDASMIEADQGGIRFSPVVDGHFLPKSLLEIYSAGQQNDVPLLAGWNRDEGGIQRVTPEFFKGKVTGRFGDRAGEVLQVYPASSDADAIRSASDLDGDLFIAYATWRWLEFAVATGKQPVYRYRFDRLIPVEPPRPSGPSAYHSGEIPYVFGNLDRLTGFAWTADDRSLSERMQKYWTNFARSGDPNGPGLPAWPRYQGSSGWQVLHLNDEVAALPDEHRDRDLLLDKLLLPQ